jgi:hypothetical protein
MRHGSWQRRSSAPKIKRNPLICKGIHRHRGPAAPTVSEWHGTWIIQIMKLDDRQIARRLAWVLLIKLLALLALWWLFVHDHRVEVDAAVMARQVGSLPASGHGASVTGASRDQ